MILDSLDGEMVDYDIGAVPGTFSQLTNVSEDLLGKYFMLGIRSRTIQMRRSY